MFEIGDVVTAVNASCGCTGTLVCLDATKFGYMLNPCEGCTHRAGLYHHSNDLLKELILVEDEFTKYVKDIRQAANL